MNWRFFQVLIWKVSFTLAPRVSPVTFVSLIDWASKAQYLDSKTNLHIEIFCIVNEITQKELLTYAFIIRSSIPSYIVPFSFAKTSIIHSTTQYMKFFIIDFVTKYGQIRRKLQIWSHLLKKSSMENYIFCAK